jgi:hypothetical protein
VGEIRLVGCTVALLLQFAKTARREDVWHLRRLPEAKRHALTACFLVEALKITLDHAVEMNDQFLGGMCRRSKNSFERKQQEYRRCFGVADNERAWVAHGGVDLHGRCCGLLSWEATEKGVLSF